MNVAVIRKISEDEVKNAIPDIESWNKHLNILNITKYFGYGGIDWYAMFVNKREMVAVMGVSNSPSTSPFDGEKCFCTICAKPGQGYGRAMIHSMYEFFDDHHSDDLHGVGFICNPEGGDNLLNYYKTWFNENTGWITDQNEFGWNCFHKNFT